MSPCRRLVWPAALAAAVGLSGIAGPAAAQGRNRAKPSAAPAQPPTVVLGGLRIVAPGMGEEGTEIRAFNESPGTALALFVKFSDGSGIVDIDEDKSALNVVKDDTGANLLEEGRIGPFPKITKDGSTGMIEVETRGRPSPGATYLVAEGTIALTSSAGTKVQKVANVKFEAGKAFKVGTANVTIGEVSAQGEYGTLSLKLPRSTLLSIKEFRFKDAKGQAVAADRMGSGWMGEDAEVSFRIPADLKAANLELEVWQNLKEQTVPFNVKVGLSLR
ncbi:MAG TPA: hypothetical protein VF310_05455 [Vicinamibacteria bacterium]